MNSKQRIVTIFLSFLLFPLVTFAYTSPGKPQGFVNDFAQVLTTEERQQLEMKLSAFEKETSNELSIVTILTVGEDETIETYAIELFEEWGIGKRKNDNGILLLVAVNDRKMRIEVGYGLEGAVPDAVASSIIRNTLTPAFRNNDFYGGIDRATDELMAATRGEYVPEEGNGEGFRLSEGLIFFVVYLFLWMVSILGRSKSWWLGGVIGGVIALVIGFWMSTLIGGLIAFVLLVPFGLFFDFIVSRTYHKHVASGSRHYPWWIGGGGNGRSGGFGGFGGGRSGGGGSSGSW